jgi:hypothetical protein
MGNYCSSVALNWPPYTFMQAPPLPLPASVLHPGTWPYGVYVFYLPHKYPFWFHLVSLYLRRSIQSNRERKDIRIECDRRMVTILLSCPHSSPWVSRKCGDQARALSPYPICLPSLLFVLIYREHRHRAPWPPAHLLRPSLASMPPSALLRATSVQTDHPIAFLALCHSSHTSLQALTAPLSSTPPASTRHYWARAHCCPRATCC